MSEAIASSPSTSTSNAAARPSSASRGESWIIAALLGGVGAAGVLVQQFVPPGPPAMALTALATSAGLIAACAAVRGRLLDTVAGFRLAAVLLVVLATSAGLGTLIVQNRPAQFYQSTEWIFSNLLTHLNLPGPARAVHRAEAALILGLRLDDLFHSVWFSALMGVLVAGLVASAARRLPLRLSNAGFFAVHLGICVCLAGAAISSVFAVKGRVDLRLGGEPASTVAVTRNGVATGERLPLGAKVQLESFDVDRYREQLRASVYGPSKNGGRMALEASFESEVGLEQRLPGGGTFRIKAFYPDFALNERAVASAAGSPALEVSQGTRAEVLTAEKPRFTSPDGKVAVLFGWQRPQAPSGALGARHELRLNGGPAAAVELGQTVALGDLRIEALRFFPHFALDAQSQSAVTLSQEPKNPALEVELDGRRQWLFARMPGFAHGGGDGPNLVYTFHPAPAAGSTTVLVGGADRTVVIRRPSGEETVSFEEGLEVAGLRLGKLLEKAQVTTEPGTASQEERRPAALFEVDQGGQLREGLLVANERDAIQVGERRFLTYETRGDEVKSFRSLIGIDAPGERRSAIVAVNEPIDVAGWMLYQVNYDPNDPTYSGLEAVRDPGVPWVFAGFCFLFAGVTYMIYVAPRLKRRRPQGA